MSTVPPLIAVIDDNPHEIELLRLALDDAGIAAECCALDDGNAFAALDALAGRRPPSLVLIDINMPRVRGFEVLAYLKSHPVLGAVPAVVVTTSSSASDRERCLGLGAEDFVVKPADFGAYVVTARQLARFFQGERRRA